MNAVNFVDGLDGLAGGRGRHRRGRVLPLLLLRLARRQRLTLATTGALLSAALAGACAGFLPHNFHPGPDLHGRLRLDADRPGAVGERADPDRAVRRACQEHGRQTACS